MEGCSGMMDSSILVSQKPFYRLFDETSGLQPLWRNNTALIPIAMQMTYSLACPAMGVELWWGSGGEDWVLGGWRAGDEEVIGSVSRNALK